jgi:hypothetical protein
MYTQGDGSKWMLCVNFLCYSQSSSRTEKLQHDLWEKFRLIQNFPFFFLQDSEGMSCPVCIVHLTPFMGPEFPQLVGKQ